MNGVVKGTMNSKQWCVYQKIKLNWKLTLYPKTIKFLREKPPKGTYNTRDANKNQY